MNIAMPRAKSAPPVKAENCGTTSYLSTLGNMLRRFGVIGPETPLIATSNQAVANLTGYAKEKYPNLTSEQFPIEPLSPIPTTLKPKTKKSKSDDYDVDAAIADENGDTDSSSPDASTTPRPTTTTTTARPLTPEEVVKKKSKEYKIRKQPC